MPEPLDARERRELCDLLADLGPDAPTLCEGWTTFDLAVHLVVRERNPSAAPGILFGGPFARLLARAEGKARASGYQGVVERVRNGPPIGPFAVPGLRGLINMGEYAIHHEDVRRANGMPARHDRPDLQAALWKQTQRGARLQLRKVKGAVVRLARPGEDDVVVGKEGPSVTVTGEPMEIALYLFGRRAAAQVAVTGDPGAIAILEAATLGV